MTIITEKPSPPPTTKNPAASPPKPRTKHHHLPLLRRLFTLNLTRKPTPAPIFPHTSFPNYAHLEALDYHTEATMGTTHCPTCQSAIQITREVLIKPKQKVVDNLRFEQSIENGAGRSVKTVKTSFNEDYIEFKKCDTRKLDGEWRTNRDGSRFELLWEKDYVGVQCVACEKTVEFVNHVRRNEGEERVRWFMTYKI